MKRQIQHIRKDLLENCHGKNELDFLKPLPQRNPHEKTTKRPEDKTTKTPQTTDKTALLTAFLTAFFGRSRAEGLGRTTPTKIDSIADKCSFHGSMSVVRNSPRRSSHRDDQCRELRWVCGNAGPLVLFSIIFYLSSCVAICFPCGGITRTPREISAS